MEFSWQEIALIELGIRWQRCRTFRMTFPHPSIPWRLVSIIYLSSIKLMAFGTKQCFYIFWTLFNCLILGCVTAWDCDRKLNIYIFIQIQTIYLFILIISCNRTQHTVCITTCDTNFRIYDRTFSPWQTLFIVSFLSWIIWFYSLICSTQTFRFLLHCFYLTELL